MKYYINLENDAVVGQNEKGQALNVELVWDGDAPTSVNINGVNYKLRPVHWKCMLEGSYIYIDTDKTKYRILGHIPTQSIGNGQLDHSSFKMDELDIPAVRLSDLEFNPILFQTIKTNTVVDRFWSEDEGMYRGTITMVSGDPGAGKTSVLVSQLINMGKVGAKIGIVSAEMKPLDLERSIAKYYPEIREVDVLYPGPYLAGKALDPNGNPIPFNVAFQAFLNKGYDVVLLDSMKEIQEIIRYELDLAKEKAEFFILDILEKNAEGHNKEGRYTSFLLIQQVGKGGEFVGTQRLVHMINARIEIRHCKEQKGAKYLVFKKNRNGLVGVKLYFQFGLAGVVYDESRLEAELELMGMLANQVDFKDTNIGELLGKLSVAEMQAQEDEFNGLDRSDDDE